MKLGLEFRRIQMSSRRNHIPSRCVWLAHVLLRRAQVHVSFLIKRFYCNFQNLLFNPSDFHCVTPTFFLPIFLDLWITYDHLENIHICIFFCVCGRHACIWILDVQRVKCVYLLGASFCCICKPNTHLFALLKKKVQI